MGILQNEFDQALQSQCSTEALKAAVLRRAARAKNLVLTDEQMSQFAQAISAAEKSNIDQVSIGDGESRVEISTADLSSAMGEVSADLDRTIEGAIQAATDEVPANVLGSLYADTPRMLQEHKRMTQAFEKRLYSHWQGGLDRLKMLIVIAQESGSGFVDDSANWRRNLKGRKAERKLHLFDAILGLHLRACRVASEVFCLLKSGFADGAMARWRTLHELAIVIMFLWQHKGDCGTRYLSHAFIERFKAARQYQCHCGRLGHEPHSPSEMHEFRADYDSVVAKYGTDFATEYGWAAKAIGIKCPTFADIEKSIDLAHWRPYFKMACHSVHAGPQALGFSLGSPTGQPYAGASNAGLADPGHSTAISLTLATSSFLTLRTNLDGLVACQIMRRLTDDIGREFLKANKAMEEKILAEAAEG